MNKPKTKPILFTPEMVRAILDGRKAQTRRVIKDVPTSKCLHIGRPIMEWPLSGVFQDQDGDWQCDVQIDVDDFDTFPLRCPYGTPGDTLWVRSKWRNEYHEDRNQTWWSSCGRSFTTRGKPPKRTGNHPSIHMPYWLSSELFHPLRITDIRVERVQDISDEEIVAEGAWNPAHSVDEDCSQPREAWMNLWDSINQNRGFGWEMNPFVWCVTFEMEPIK